ncbi:AAA family ATPase [Spirosoma validum]|uniref:ATP-binding protein n=1 Tax=Spirosoma validum TaxID=2771355 RepID=A0A927B2U0_9BACT|nr:ATP-binding protein [Spirosoma validum]MBD2754550.1 ATP-binding protein [Spirosoma validum]
MLKRVSIQNFKSLKDITLDLQKVNLLIGPNNSGKTNFLKALEFCYDAHGLEEIEMKIGDEDEAEETGMFIIENYTIVEKYNYLKTVFKRNGQSEVSFQLLFDDNVKAYIEWSAEKSRIVRNVDGSNGKFFNAKESIQALKNDLGKITIYKPDSNKLTQPGLVGTGEEVVNADCSNLVGFLDLMLGKYRRTVFNRTENDLSTCIPEFDEINLEDASPTDELKKLHGDKSFKRIGLSNSKQDITYWADELSEGTLYFLALLCIINQPNPPKLLLLEEPEKGIHPRRIREVMDFIFRLAEEKDIQIILTTHNENVLNEFTSMPEAVFVFSKDEEGSTHVKNLQKDIIEPSHQRSRETGTKEIDFTSNLGENWMYGLLGGVPEEVL